MHDISDLNQDGLPSSASLLKATLIALVIGAIILVTTILPAEYGIDPTGLGTSMGLTALSTANASEQEQPSGNLLLASSELTPVWKHNRRFRSDTLTITLQPNEGTEVKAEMEKGERFVFSWEVNDGNVSFDMHGEPPGRADTFTSYWKARNQANSHGEFVAPFNGTHGWYWHNGGTKPITLTLDTSGFYKKLYQL